MSLYKGGSAERYIICMVILFVFDSTINHVGFLLLALSVFTNSAMSQAMDAFIFYIFQYTITNLNVFLILLAYGYISNINKKSIYNSYFKILGGLNDEINAPLHGPLKKHELEATSKRLSSLVLFDLNYLKTLKGMFFKNPLLSISLSLSLFSFAGVPPLIGFFAKQQVLYTATSAGFYFLSLIAIIVSVISASYYLKLIKILTIRPEIESAISNNKAPLEILTEIITSVKPKGYSLSIFSHPHVSLSNIHCFLIGVITMILILFIFNPEIIFNTIAITTSFILNIKNE